MPSSDDREAMTAFITGLIAGTVQEHLTKPVKVLDVSPEGRLVLKLASGMLVRIDVLVTT